MPIDPSEDQMEEQSASVTPGALLRQARVDRGLDEKDIAERLHITVHYVKAIEGDMYEKLPGIVFAKGYLKSYATAVGLAPETVLQSFTQLQPGQQGERTQLRNAGGRRKKSRYRGLQWALASVGCFALLITVAWYLSSATPSDSVQRQAATPSQSRTPAVPDDTVTPEIATAVQIATDNNADIAQQVEASNAEIDEALDEQLTAPITNTAQNLQAAIDEEVTDAVAADSDAVSASEPVTSDPATTSANRPEDLAEVNVLQGDNGERIIAVDAHGEDLLRISFSGESWVEINDGEDRQIYRDLRSQGDILEVSGHAPFNILLGDAPYTSLKFNGSDIDVSENIRIDNSARLTVGL